MNYIELANGNRVAAVFNFDVLMQIQNKIPGNQLKEISKGNFKDVNALMNIFLFMIQAGERTEGRECSLTLEDLKRFLPIGETHTLLQIVMVQTQSFTQKPVYYRNGLSRN